jgi:hypothetical protein
VKYLIVSKNEVSGTYRNDSGKLNEYFELGWEAVGSRFDVIALHNKGMLDPNEITIVTVKDRMFFYTAFYESVISYEDFLNSFQREKDQIIGDWPSNHLALGFCQDSFADSNGKYVRYKEDENLIRNGWDLKGAIDPQEPFLVLAMRKRAWCDNRNTDISIFQGFVRKFRKYIPIYVVGRGFEDFCSMNKINYVEKLKDYVSLIQNVNCVSLIAQSTGTALLGITCAKTDIHILDPTGASDVNGNNAVLGGKPCHFFTKELFVYKEGFEDFKNQNYKIMGKVMQNLKKK